MYFPVVYCIYLAGHSSPGRERIGLQASTEIWAGLRERLSAIETKLLLQEIAESPQDLQDYLSEAASWWNPGFLMFFLDLFWTAKEFLSSENGLRQLLPAFRIGLAEWRSLICLLGIILRSSTASATWRDARFSIQILVPRIESVRY